MPKYLGLMERKMQMNNYVEWDKVPDVMSKETFYKVCHISKATALELIQTKKIPSKYIKRIHTYQIKKEDVMKYGNRIVYRTTGGTAPYYPKEYGAICSVYGDVVTDYKSMGQCENQMSFADYGIFDNERPLLKTTGCQRTGCVLCGFGCHLEKESRFLRLKETHPKFHNLLYILKNNGVTYAEAIDWVNEHGNMNIKY